MVKGTSLEEGKVYQDYDGNVFKVLEIIEDPPTPLSSGLNKIQGYTVMYKDAGINSSGVKKKYFSDKDYFTLYTKQGGRRRKSRKARRAQKKRTRRSRR